MPSAHRLPARSARDLAFRVGWTVTVGLTLLVVLLVGYRWRFDLLKQILSITVLHAVFSTYQGNIDGLLLALFLLPARWQMVFILTKPQSVGGLAARALRYKEGWLILTLLTAMVLVFRFQDSLSFLRTAQGLNAIIWHGINPLQFVRGATLLLIAIRRSDERLLPICSPFLSPYVTVGSL